MRPRSVVLFALALVLAAVLPTAALAQSPEFAPQEPPRHITVVGRGVVTVSPDVATTTIGVETMAEDVAEAVSQNSDSMDAIIAALQEVGIAGEDIQTADYNIYFDEGWRGPDVAAQPTYRVINMVRVTLRDLQAIGEVIDAAVTAGANRIYGISFAVSETGEAEAEAREEAVADAEQRAQHLASLVGASVGDVISVSEVVAGGYQPFLGYTQPMMGGGGGGPAISPGSLEFSTAIQVTYRLLAAEGEAEETEENGAAVATAEVAPADDLPSYTLTLLPNPSPEEQDDGLYLVAWVEVAAEDEEPVQTLEVLFHEPYDLWNVETIDFLIVDDINFDGLMDFAVVEPGGATWQVGHWYLYDDIGEEFFFGFLSEQLRLLPWAGYTLDADTQEITFTNMLGATGAVETVYAVEDDELVLVRADEDAPTLEDNPFTPAP